MNVNPYPGVSNWNSRIVIEAKKILSHDSEAVFLPDNSKISKNIIDTCNLLSIGATVVLCGPCQIQEISNSLGKRSYLTSTLQHLDKKDEDNDSFFFINFENAPMPSDLAKVWVATTGTTGTPKFVEHSVKSILELMKPPIKSAVTWGLTYAYYKFAGLQVFLQALKGQAKIVGLEQRISSENTTRLAALFHESGVTHISTTPSLARQLLAAGFRSEFVKVITLGGERAEQRTLTALRQTFPKAKLRHIYASTELGAVLTVADGLEGIPCSMLDGNDRFEFDSQGQLLVRPLAASPGRYVDPTQIFLVNKLFATGDILKKYGDRYLFEGRSSSTVNVGGNKVLPEKIEAFLLNSFPDIQSVVVSGIPNPIMGEVLSATLGVRSGCEVEDLKKEIKARCKEELPSHERPVKYTFTDNLELNESGKTKRNS